MDNNSSLLAHKSRSKNFDSHWEMKMINNNNIMRIGNDEINQNESAFACCCSERLTKTEIKMFHWRSMNGYMCGVCPSTQCVAAATATNTIRRHWLSVLCVRKAREEEEKNAWRHPSNKHKQKNRLVRLTSMLLCQSNQFKRNRHFSQAIQNWQPVHHFQNFHWKFWLFCRRRTIGWIFDTHV